MEVSSTATSRAEILTSGSVQDASSGELACPFGRHGHIRVAEGWNAAQDAKGRSGTLQITHGSSVPLDWVHPSDVVQKASSGLCAQHTSAALHSCLR
jgi:hypothetical protein